MDYAATLEYLYRKLPMYQRVGPRAFKKDLTNTIRLLQGLGRPHLRFPAVHVAGTNGKGSVASMIASVLQHAGFRTGLYTSPHLMDFRERIRVDGRPIGQDEVVRFVEARRGLIEEVAPSFFEITVALAFDRFAAREVDLAVVETGLGGRLDSTNVVHPLVSVITSIGHDHQEFLGHSLREIAAEKAGIIKAGRPVVLGECPDEAFDVFRERAAVLRAPLFLASETVNLRDIRVSPEGVRAAWYRHGRALLPDLRTDLGGTYQVANLRTALQALLLVEEEGFDLTGEAWRRGLAEVRATTGLRGRFQVLCRAPWTIVDGAHNPEGLRALFDTLAELDCERLHIVFGTVRDKDPLPLLQGLPREGAHYYFARPDVPRGADAARLRDRAAGLGLRGRAYRSVHLALKAAERAAAESDAVVVCGSLYVAAEVPYEKYEGAAGLTPDGGRRRS